MRLTASQSLETQNFMSLAESISWSFIRCLIVATVSLLPVLLLVRHLQQLNHHGARRFRTLIILTPFFVPELLLGFHYRLTATQLSLGYSESLSGITTEGLYAVLQIVRSIAVGTAITLLMSASSVSRESLYSWSLLRPSLHAMIWWRHQIILLATGPWRGLITAWSLMSLISFQEFETAALMQIDRHPVSWSVWIFDAQATRQPLSDSLNMILIPGSLELLLLSPAIGLIVLTGPRPSPDFLTGPAARIRESDRSDNRSQQLHLIRSTTAAVIVLPGLTLCVVWPFVSNIRPAATGFLAMLANPALMSQSLQQILTSTGFALASAMIALQGSLILINAPSRHTHFRRHMLITAGMLLPGLMGSLVLGLVLLSVFQWPGLRILYDTWLPMLLGQSAAVFPRAFAVALLLCQTECVSGQYSAELLKNSSSVSIRNTASRLLWHLKTRRWLLGGLIVSYWCFWDVTIASILRPVRLEPVVTRLYNEMHYGRTESLTSLTALAALTPCGIWLLVMAGSRIFALCRRPS